MDNFLNRYHLLKLNKDQNLNWFIIPSEIEGVIESLPIKKQNKTKPKSKNPEPDNFRAELCKTFKEKWVPMLFKLFHRVETEGTLPNSFYKAAVTLILKSYKNKENYRPISFMNININILNKIRVNQIQKHIKKDHQS